MATTLSGGKGTDVILPEGVTTDQVEVASNEDGGTAIAIKQNSSIAVKAKGDTAITGKKISESSVSVAAKKSESTNIVFETTVVKNTTVTNEGKGTLEVNINTGKHKNLTIDATVGGEKDKKRDDLVRVKDGVRMSKGRMNMGRGDDTVRFGDVTFKGRTIVDLGKGGKDAVVLEAAPAPGKLIVTSFSKKDTITVGDETFTFQDIKKGAEIPGVKVELA